MNIRQERMQRGWTQEYVAKAVGITKAAYRNIEAGVRSPSYSVLVKLLDLFEYSDPRKLFGAAPPAISEALSGNRANQENLQD